MKNKSSGSTPLKGFKRWPKRNNSPSFLLTNSRLNLFIILTLFIQLSSSFAQTREHQTWLVGDKFITFPAAYNTKATPTVTHTFSGTMPAQETPDLATSDEAGNLLFYVRDYKVYDRLHTQIGVIPGHIAGGGRIFNQAEISVIPFIEPLNCVRRYYIFYPLHNGASGQTYLRAMIATVNTISGAASVVEYKNGIYAINLATSNFVTLEGPTPEPFGYTASSLAVTPLMDYNQLRYLYFVSGSSIQKISIGTFNNTNYGLSAASDLNVTGSRVFFTSNQAELSKDGRKLAWGCIPNEYPRLNDGAYFVISLDGLGNWTGPIKKIYLPDSLDAEAEIQYGIGVTFNDNATKLFVTTGWAYDIGTMPVNGIYEFDIATGAGTLIPGTTSYAESQLRVGNNGLLYARNDDSLTAWDLSTKARVHNIPITRHLSSRNFNYLPEQVYGETTPYFPYFDNPVDPTSQTYQNFEYTSGIHVWNPAAFGGKTTIKITGPVYVKNSGTELTIENMTVEFDDEAEFIMQSSATVILRNCTLKGLNGWTCKSMWKGISISSLSTSSLLAQGTATEPIIIQDAITGINANGSGVILWLDYVTLRANETNLGLYGSPVIYGGTQLTFDGSVPLRNQNYGSNNGYTDNLKRTNHNLTMWDSPIIGIPGAVFKGGQFGIYAYRPTGASYSGGNFKGQKRAGIHITNANATISTMTFFANSFNGTLNGIRMHNSKGARFVFKGNTFDSVTYNGIEAYNNKGCTFQIGYDTTASGYANSFTHSGAAAIYLHNNADVINTEINIARNTISSSTAASHGIIISENSAGQKKYKAMKVINNIISNTARGIKLLNVVGGNPINPTKRDLQFYPVSQIISNTITTDAQPGSQGVETGASKGNSYVGNSLNGNKYGMASNLVNSTSSLFHGNTSTTGYGLMAQGHMYHSNYYCNTFIRANYGIYLANHILRVNSAETHGDFLTKARDNDFFTKPTSKPNYNISLDASNVLWNKWKFSTTFGIPNIANINGGSTAIFAGYETGICTVPDLPDSTSGGTHPGLTADVTGPLPIFWNEYTNQQNFKIGYDSIGTADSNIVRLIDAEDLMASGDFAAALGRINSIVITPSAPDEFIMADYKLLHQTYLAYRMADTIGRTMNDSMVAILTTIAQKNPVTTSPVSHTAQAILYDERQLLFNHTPIPSLLLTGFISNTCTLPDKEGIAAYLVDAAGNAVEGPVLTDADGQFAFDGGLVALYSSDANPYKIRLILPDGSMVETDAATVAELALASDHEMDCESAIGPFVISGLVHADDCPLQVTSNIMTYLLKQNDELVEGPVMVSSVGTFAFDPMITALHNNSDLYKIKLVFADATTATTNAATITDLAAASVHEFNCPDGPPIILPKKGKENGPITWKEEVNEFEKEIPFSVSPNPSTGIFVIKGAGNGAKATLTNLLGQIVVKDLPLTNGILDASHLNKGVYLLTVTGKHQTYVRKVNLIK